MDHPAETLLDAIERVREADGRYSREAYLFLVAALGHGVEQLPAERRADPVRRHLSGREVIAAMLGLGGREFGPLAATVFTEWGVTRGRDVGEMVFELVAAGQLSTQPEDCIEDFELTGELLAGLPALPESRKHLRGPA